MMGAIAGKFEFWVIYICMIRVKMQHQINISIYLLMNVTLTPLWVDNVRLSGLHKRTVRFSLALSHYHKALVALFIRTFCQTSFIFDNWDPNIIISILSNMNLRLWTMSKSTPLNFMSTPSLLLFLRKVIHIDVRAWFILPWLLTNGGACWSIKANLIGWNP